jgi:hypothetical protein
MNGGKMEVLHKDKHLSGTEMGNGLKLATESNGMMQPFVNGCVFL